ncbi:MAG: Hpt domain-containing protein, partial [Nitrospirae bacterium]|nr:Hpt domain-containing protein [Nitrospirota bacterium]
MAATIPGILHFGQTPTAGFRFIQDAANCIEEMNQAKESQDLQKIAEVSQGLKGICLNLGVTRLAERCQNLEKQAKEEMTDNMTDEIHQIQEEFALTTSVVHENISSQN